MNTCTSHHFKTSNHCTQPLRLPFFIIKMEIVFLFILSVLQYLPSQSAFAAASPTPPVVMVSILPQQYIVQRVAGDIVTCQLFIPAGRDPHTFEPSPAQMKSASIAKAYLYLGVQFEQIPMQRLAQVAPTLPFINMSNNITFLPLNAEHNHIHHAPSPTQSSNDSAQHPLTSTQSSDAHALHVQSASFIDTHNPLHILQPFNFHAQDNPHIWLSPSNIATLAINTQNALTQLFPQHAEVFAANTNAFLTTITQTNATITSLLSSIPQEKRVFLTFHPSWGYFAHSYQFTELSIEVEGKEPAPRAIKAVIDMARKHTLRCIFVEPQFSQTTAQAIAENINASVFIIDPLAEDTLHEITRMAHALAKQATSHE